MTETGSIEVKRLPVSAAQCRCGSGTIDRVVRSCICRYRRVRKGSYDRNERRKAPSVLVSCRVLAKFN